MLTIDNITQVEQYLDDIDGVVFDLDDTLYSEREYVWSGYQAIAKQFPQVDHVAQKLWAVFEKGGMAIDEVFAAEGLLEYKSTALQIYRFHEPNLHLYEGVRDMLDRIKSSGRKIGIITDGRPEGQHAKLKALGIQVDHVIITDELGGIIYRKPNTTAFEIMKQKMNLEYSRILYVGDNLGKDLIAPEKLGMKSILFKNKDGLYFR